MNQVTDGTSSPDDMLDVIDPDAMPKWPKVVGIISISWASLGLCCAGLGVVGIAFQGQMMQAAGVDASQMPPQNNAMQIASIAGGTFVALLLLAAGILCVVRNGLTRPLHLVYSLLAVVSMAFGIWASMKQNAAMMDWARQNPENQFAKQMLSTGNMSQSIGLIVMVALSAPWPLFCLVWFGFVKSRAWQLLSGTAPKADGGHPNL